MTLGRLLFAVFLIVPMIEIGLFILIGDAIGILPTMAGVVITALIGSMIVRQQGLSLISDIRGTLRAGGLPAKQLAEGMMVGIAGALLLTPGYFTDTIGFLLLVPALRTFIYTSLKSRITVVGATSYSRKSSEDDPRRPTRPDVIDLEDDHYRGN